MSIQDDAFDVDNVLEDGNLGKADLRVAKEAWNTFRKWAWSLEDEYDKLKQEHTYLLNAIRVDYKYLTDKKIFKKKGRNDT